MVSDSPLRSSLINDGGQLSKISECKKDALSKNFRNDGISHSNIVCMKQKRRLEPKVTGKDAYSRYMPPKCNVPSGYYERSLNGELIKPAFTNDAVKMSFKQTSTN